jgi:23S rRNA (cytosine1962-C5)-methyltransferase
MSSSSTLEVIESTGFDGYALLDCGGGRKLERFGDIIVDRPEPQAMWQQRLTTKEWAAAHAVFSASSEDSEKGKWRIDKPVPEQGWPVKVDAVTMTCRMQGLWHLGLFPEQYPHWQWLVDRLKKSHANPPRVLNLFGYTGAASLIAAANGAEVTHVDASKKAIAWARENQSLSGLQDSKIRWIVDDALKFAARDVRRGRQYDVIVVDPPKFGRGPNGEVWDLFTSLPELLGHVEKLLAPGPSALVLTVYAIRASSLAVAQTAQDTLCQRKGTFESGELVLRSKTDRVLPTSLFLKWTGHA